MELQNQEKVKKNAGHLDHKVSQVWPMSSYKSWIGLTMRRFIIIIFMIKHPIYSEIKINFTAIIKALYMLLENNLVKL